MTEIDEPDASRRLFMKIKRVDIALSRYKLIPVADVRRDRWLLSDDDCFNQNDQFYKN